MADIFVISIDIGTSSTKTILFTSNKNSRINILYFTSTPNNVYYPDENSAEQDPEEVYTGVAKTIIKLLNEKKLNPQKISAIIVDGVLHSITPISADNKKLTNSIIWADSRGVEQSEVLRKELDNREIRKRTGCSINPLYFPSKILWYKQKTKDIFRKTSRFISIKEYVLFKLTGEYVVDKSTASGTGLFNIHNETWDKNLLTHIGIKEKNLSEIVEPLYSIKLSWNHLPAELKMLEGIPLLIGGGDGPLAHLGSAGLDEERLSLTLGSSAAMRKWIEKPVVNPEDESWYYYIADGNWVSGGVAHDAGLAMNWLSKNFFNSELDYNNIVEEILKLPPGSEGLIFLPLLSGERAIQYKPWVKGFIYGLSYQHGKAHVYRAFLEGLAYRLRKIYDMLSSDRERVLVVNGGMARSKPILQVLSDYMGKKFILPSNQEAASVGNLILALKFLGEIKSIRDINKLNQDVEVINPKPDVHYAYKNLFRAHEKYYRLLFK